MNWIEVRIDTSSDAAEAVSHMLMSLGSGGVAIEDPYDIRREIERPGSLDYTDDDFLGSLGDDVVIKAYFTDDRNKGELLHTIKERLNQISQFLDTGKCRVLLSHVDEEDWSTAWKKYYKPFRISQRVVIKPSWESYKPEEDVVVIEVDPGMAFGTGTHDTTRMCAALIDKYITEGDSVLDVGCGTGILSIISAKLGAKAVTAVDIDTAAVKVARENCRLNKVENCVEVHQGTLESLETAKSDIVVANIIADVIIDISKRLSAFSNPGGYFITSGIIREREAEVVEKYTEFGFSVEERVESGEWVAVVFKCQGSL